MSITVHISGGLGNQMFQYATGRALALARSTDLVLDNSSFSHDKLRSYMIDHYQIKGSVMEPMSWFMEKISSFVRTYFGLYPNMKVYGEKSNVFDKGVLSLTDNTYLLGHWQSENYFKDYSVQIKKDLTLLRPLSKSSSKIMSQIRKVPSVAVHVRRGDYVSNSVAHKVLGTLSLVYYQKAVAYLMSKVNQPHFFVFSDDPVWVSQNILVNHPNTTYLRTSRMPYEDLELMRVCNHFIIANSSFSWWAAWLGSKKGTIVISPKRWFASNMYSSKDLIPKHWIQI